MKWYEQKWVNHRDWVLDNLAYLGLSEQETVLVLLIDFMNENHTDITMESLSEKTGLTTMAIDPIISSLCAKNYLSIKANKRKPQFLLNGLFETDIAREKNVLDQSLFDTFETAFKRPLSHSEMETLSSWRKDTDKKLIIYALREAAAAQKLSMNYVSKVLTDWKAKGITVEQIEKGI